MLDVGTSPEKAGVVPTKAEKTKKYYPSFTVDKALEVKMGQKIVAEGVVTGLRKDKYGNSVTIEVKQIGIKGKMSDEEFEKMSDEEQDKTLEKGR